MKNTVKINSAELVHADSLEYIKTLPDNSLDAIITDPPYYRVKANAWDNQWPSVTDYLAWLDEFFAEFWRVLKPAGSLYVFCGPKLSSDTELLLRDRFNVLNHIVWAKPSGRWNGARKEGFRSYFPASEHIFFAEHYGAEGFAKGQAGYATKCQELKGQVFEPLIAYFRDARQRLGISAAEINAATGTKMCSHWFSASQWQLPNERQYLALQALFNRKAAEQGITGLSEPHAALQEEYGSLTALYSELVMQYSELRQQYENLRRPFHVTKDVPHTNVDVSTGSVLSGQTPMRKTAADDARHHFGLYAPWRCDRRLFYGVGCNDKSRAAVRTRSHRRRAGRGAIFTDGLRDRKTIINSLA